jgi:hypothetical protein
MVFVNVLKNHGPPPLENQWIQTLVYDLKYKLVPYLMKFVVLKFRYF